MTASTMTAKSVKDSTARTDNNPVYKTVVREMKTLKDSVESPSGHWTLIKDHANATSSFTEKLK